MKSIFVLLSACSAVAQATECQVAEETTMLQARRSVQKRSGPVLAGYEPGSIGACRTADGDGGSGMYSRADNADSVELCASECDASPTCWAFEFTGVTSGDTGCELHRQAMPAATEHPNGMCYNKIPAGPVLAGYGPGSSGACRTADGDGGSGMYTRADNADSVELCASECDASPTCLAFEFTGVTSGDTGCELHSQAMPAATGHPNGLCYNQVAEETTMLQARRSVQKRSSPVLAGYLAGIIGACRTADGRDGSDTATRVYNADSVELCARECDDSRTCLAFEFTGVAFGDTDCELHSQAMPVATGDPNYLCYTALA